MASSRQKRLDRLKRSNKSRAQRQLIDATYVLKLIMYLIIGTFWVRLANTSGTSLLPIPVGLVIGVIFASHEHFRIDRKIEYGVLLVAMFIGVWTQAGLYITY